MYVNLQSIIVPHILPVIQKEFILLIWFILMFESLYQTLVYQGSQTYGVDYETFAPMVKMNMIRIILSLAAYFGLELQQFV